MRDPIHTTPIVVDLETYGPDDSVVYAKEAEPDKRLKDPAKIEIDRIEKQQAIIDRISLDWNVGAVAALCYWTEEHGLVSFGCPTELDEIASLAHFWAASRHRTIVGFNLKGFDLRFMVRRSQLLGVHYPVLDFGKYSRKGITDLFLDLTFGDGVYDQGSMRRTLSAFCKRFGIPCDDSVAGKDVAALVKAGKWDEVVAHCENDVRCTVALARRLGVVREPVEELVR